MNISGIMFNEIITITMTLFAVIDIFGSIPIVLDLREKFGKIESLKATLISFFIMVLAYRMYKMKCRTSSNCCDDNIQADFRNSMSDDNIEV